MRRSRLSQYKQNKLIELFVAGVTARTAAQLVGVNKNTAAYYFHRLRLLIFHSSPHLEMFDGEVEKECEWRFNNSEIKVQISILKQLVKHDLF